MRKLNLEDTKITFDKIHNFKYDYSLFVEYINVKQKIEILCPIHGIFSQKIDMHKIGQGCPDCKSEKIGNLKRFSIDELIKKFENIHLDKYDYSLITQYSNSNEYIDIICKKHGIFKQTTHHHLKGQGCIKCYNDIRGDYLKSTKEEFIKKANIIHNNRYNYPFDVYKNNKTKIEIECKIHGIFQKKPNSHLSGEGCPHCFASNGEKKIFFILKGNQIRFVTQKIFKKCKNINNLRFDFFLPEYNLCIEYNGQQHYNIIDIWGGEQSFIKIKERDKIKEKYCELNNIKLLKISYLEFSDIYNILKLNLNKDILNFEIENDINLSYNDAKEIVKSLNIKSLKDYNIRYKEYLGLPSNPNSLYKKDWINWGDFLGTGRIQDNLLTKNYLSYTESKKWIANNIPNIKSVKMWKIGIKNDKIPFFIPNIPNRFYKNKDRGWLGWKDFFN